MNYNNVTIILFTGKYLNQILLLRDKKTQEWMLPGGRIESTDSNPFEALEREFKEETGFLLPPVENLQYWKESNKTLVYMGYTQYKLPERVNTYEADRILYPTIQSVKSGKFQYNYGKLKDYCMQTLCFI